MKEPVKEPPAKEPEPVCALDGEPVNSKIVVLRHTDGAKVPVLMTPRGEVALTIHDLAHRLPSGARIRKEGEARYVAEQVDGEGRPALVTTTARAAIEQFLQHFHG